MRNVLLIILCFFSLVCPAKDYFVAVDGNDNHHGGIDAPLRTIEKAVRLMRDGDVCYLRGGCYHSPIRLKNCNKDIRILSYPGEKAVLTGALPLEGLKWRKESEHVYSAELDRPISQLFVNGKSMCAARWPNGNWYDGSVWNSSTSMMWPEAGSLGSYTNTAVGNLGFSIEGAMMVVNSGSFRTYQTVVTRHRAHDNEFEYDKTTVKSHFSNKTKVNSHGYFLEGKKEFIDVPGEWFYDRNEKRIYLYPEEEMHPSELKLEGKVVDYMVEALRCSKIAILGIDFFGATVSFIDCSDIRLEDCNFLYPSFNERMLGSLEKVKSTQFVNNNNQIRAGHQIVNCMFEFGDGPALRMKGREGRIYNCLFHDFDFSCVNDGGYMFDLGRMSELHFVQNTAWTTGNSEMLQVGPRSVVELNDLSRCGLLQNDGALIQVSVGGQNGTVVRYNWVHNSVRQGIRFDNSNLPGSPYGRNCTAHHNVVWKTDRFFLKGDEHFVYNNLSFDNKLNDLVISSDKSINGFNYKTKTYNNACNRMSGDRRKVGKEYPVPGDSQNNWVGYEQQTDVKTQLIDVDNRDFRPRAGSDLVDRGAMITGKLFNYEGKAPDVGPYEWGCSNYWIPGRKARIASVPIPHSDAVEVSHEVDLMWQPAYKSSASIVYLGKDAESMQKVSEQQNNIYTPKNLDGGETYYWRIDSKVGTQIVKGEVWQFTLKQ